MNNKSILELYKEECNQFYFSTPQYEMMTKNIVDTITFEHATEIPDKVAKLKANHKLEGKLIVGAIPFNIEEAGILYIADSWERSEVSFENRNHLAAKKSSQNLIVSMDYIPTPEKYKNIVERGIQAIKSGEFSKLVLSRGIHLTFQDRVDIHPILKQIYKNNPWGYTYVLRTAEDEVILGASPEMLISKRKNHIYSNPLAGSRPRKQDKEEDLKMADELSRTKKDLIEHKIVVDNIVEKVSSMCCDITYSKRPDLIQTNRLWHLSSVIEGTLCDCEKTVLDVALTIHPTPAVCGVPRQKACQKILELEEKSRKEFTGIIGWCDENGDGDWAITIRGAKVNNRNILINAGAGIVRDSIPEEEMKETGVKCETMLSALGFCLNQEDKTDITNHGMEAWNGNKENTGL